MRDYRINESEEQLRIHWRYVTGNFLLPVVLTILLIVLLGYNLVVGVIVTVERAIQNPLPSTIFPAVILFLLCALLFGLIVFLLFYKESLVLDHDGLTLEKRLIWLVKKRHVPLCDLQPFDYSSARGPKGRITYFVLIITTSGEFRFGMGYNKYEMPTVCQSLNRSLDQLFPSEHDA